MPPFPTPTQANFLQPCTSIQLLCRWNYTLGADGSTHWSCIPKWGSLTRGVPNLRLHNGTSCQISSDIRLENEVPNIRNALEPSRNRPPASWSMEKLSSPKPVPGVKKVGDRCLKRSLPGTPTWLGSQSIIASLTGSQILNPHLNCPWRIS